MQRKKQYEQEEQDAINANMGIASGAAGPADETGPSTVVVEPDVSDPLLTLRVEQLTAVEDVQFRYVGGKPDSVEQYFLQKGNRRPDVDGDYPFYGVDEDGNYAEPPDEATLIDWAEKNWTRLFFKKLIQYCLACGLKREDLQAEFGAVQTDKAVLAGTDERAKLQARSKALQDLERQSEYVRKLYRGAFDCKACSYFRPETQGMQDTLFFPPDEIVLAVRENSRKISAIYMTDFHNYELPPKVLHAYYQEMEKVKLSGNYFPLWGVHLHQEHIKALTDAAPKLGKKVRIVPKPVGQGEESYESQPDTVIIIDNGSGLCKVGYSTEETPTYIFPEIIGRPRAVWKDKSKQKGQPLKEDRMRAKEDMERMWTFIFQEKLKVDQQRFPVLLTEPPYNPTAKREKMVEANGIDVTGFIFDG
eukprot:s4796_g3.t1